MYLYARGITIEGHTLAGILEQGKYQLLIIPENGTLCDERANKRPRLRSNALNAVHKRASIELARIYTAVDGRSDANSPCKPFA